MTRPGGHEGRKDNTMKPYGIAVPGSVISAKTAAGYLRRTAAFLLSPARFSMESCAVLSDIESRIVSAAPGCMQRWICPTVSAWPTQNTEKGPLSRSPARSSARHTRTPNRSAETVCKAALPCGTLPGNSLLIPLSPGGNSQHKRTAARSHPSR